MKIIEAKYEQPFPLWTPEELGELTGLLAAIKDPFNIGTWADLLKKGIDLEGYPLKTSLLYFPPQTHSLKDSLFLFPWSTPFRYKVLQDGIRIAEAPLQFDISPNNIDNDEVDFSAHRKWSLWFNNAVVAGFFKAEENGDITKWGVDRSSTRSSTHYGKSSLLLPSDPHILEGAQLLFYR